MNEQPDVASAAADIPGKLTPASPSERVEVVDVIRGVALFGILAANMRGFAGPAVVYSRAALYWPSLPDRVAQAFIETFVQGKFIAIFAFLFGAGFAAQLERSSSRGDSRFTGFYVRRLFVLLLFGLAHGLLLWFGDVLLEYALIGFLLLFFRNAKERTVLRWAFVGFLTPIVALAFSVAIVSMLGVTPHMRPGPSPTELARITTVFAHGSWSAIARERLVELRYNWGMLPAFAPTICGLFLFGVLAWRRDIFRQTAEHLTTYRRIARWAFFVGAASGLVSAAIRWIFHLGAFTATPASLAAAALHTLSTPALSASYVAMIIVAFASVRGRRILHPFAAVGRLGLTTYLGQSVIAVLIFHSYGLGLFGRFGPAQLILPTIAIYALQVVCAVWWVKRFRFGPAEWLWRSLTYLRFQPMLLTDRESVVTTAAA